MPIGCKNCDIELDLFRHPGAKDLSDKAKFCPLCGKSVICPKCGKQYYWCECDDDNGGNGQ